MKNFSGRVLYEDDDKLMAEIEYEAERVLMMTEEFGLRAHARSTVTEIFSVLKERKKIRDAQNARYMEYWKDHEKSAIYALKREVAELRRVIKTGEMDTPEDLETLMVRYIRKSKALRLLIAAK